MQSWRELVDKEAVLSCISEGNEEEILKKKSRTPRVYDAASGRMVSVKGQSFGLCADCGSKRIVTRLEWQRAAKPKCLRCGGLLIRSEAEKKRARKRALSAFDREQRLGDRAFGKS